MTALRPERESGTAYGAAGGDGSSYGQQPYGAPGAFEVAIEQLADPLTDPLPGAVPAPGTAAPGRTAPAHTVPGHTAPAAPTAGPQAGPGQQWPGHHQYAGDDSAGYARQWQDAAQGGYDGARQRQPYADPATTAMPATPSFQESTSPYGTSATPSPYTPPVAPSAPAYGAPTASPGPGYGVPPTAARPLDDETVALRASEVSQARLMAAPVKRADAADDSAAASGGRAARRKAARRQGRHGGPQESQVPLEGAQEAAEAPLSRVAARRAAQARKPGAAVMVSRMIGEAFITTGVLMLLFVTYQLWWSNVRAHQQAGSAAHHLQEDWASGKRSPGTFEPGQGFAILHIPKLDVVAPIAEGTSKTKVLDRGMVGHYGEGGLKTAMPDAKTGNFGLAGHRNTHGEPFRYINQLKPGDSIVVETQDDYFVYKMTSILPVTSPSNTSVLAPVPKGSGFTGPGRYITLTTCTPEFTSTYRMIVWGKMVEERPRSKGKPDALIG
ncbi:class E sortase [Streptomyces sp. NPDC005122]